MANNPPPQILIQQPLNLEEIGTDEGVFLHAMARSSEGVSRIEVWVDGEFYFAQEGPDEGPVSPLLIHTFWQPSTVGIHEIIVRAYDANGDSSQGSVIVTAVEPSTVVQEYYDPIGYVEDEEIPDDGGESGGGEGDSGEGGDASSASESGAGDSGASAPSGPGGAPPPTDEEPDFYTIPMIFGVVDLVDIFGDEDDTDETPEDGSSLLRLEILELDTGETYETLHCYVGFGGRSSSWYPDEDEDQATDEYFTSPDGINWVVSTFLAGENGPVIYWPENEPIPIDLTCIGTLAGGTEAITVGELHGSVQPGHWDGVIRTATFFGEGSIAVSYRVSYEELEEKGPSSDVPVPFNLHYDDRRQELQWDWEGTEEHSHVAGYLVYVNDTLVYKVNSPTQAIWLPSEWLNPPCDVEYVFTVRAYYNPYPEGDYSEASMPLVFPEPRDEPRTDCNPEYVVTFETLVTGDLGGDDIRNNWAHMVEPVHGSFYANDEVVEFNHVTLYPDQTYNIYDLTSSTTGDSNHFTIEIAEGEYFRVGFDLIDYDDGNNEVLCSTMVYHDYTYSRLMGSGYIEDNLYSYEDDGMRCQVHYSIHPLDGSVVGSTNPDFIPLPWIDVIGISIDPETGFVQLDIQNNGSADWRDLPLRTDLVNRETGHHDFSIAQNVTLEVGAQTTITVELPFENVGNLCVMLDVNNDVLEHYEQLNVLQHDSYLYCLPQPDIRIDEVQFDPDSNQLRVKIRNMGSYNNDIGTSDLDLFDVVLRIEPDAGEPFIYGPNMRVHEVVQRTDAEWIEWSLTDSQRDRMLDGYTITADPENAIYETDETNNSYSVPGGAHLMVSWDAMELRWYPNSLQTCPNYGRWNSNPVDVWVDIYARSENSDDHITTWHWEGRTEGDDVLYTPGYHGWMRTPYSVDFYIEPEQNLEIYVHGEQSNHSMGGITAVFENIRNWEITQIIQPGIVCDEYELNDLGRGISIYPGGDWSWCGGWDIWVNICEIADP
jgi:hypothetical protein